MGKDKKQKKEAAGLEAKLKRGNHTKKPRARKMGVGKPHGACATWWNTEAHVAHTAPIYYPPAGAELESMLSSQPAPVTA